MDPESRTQGVPVQEIPLNTQTWLDRVVIIQKEFDEMDT